MRVLLFASVYLPASGDSASILFFGTFALLSFLGMLPMDQRHRPETDPKCKVFMDKISMVSFLALLRGAIAGFTL